MRKKNRQYKSKPGTESSVILIMCTISLRSSPQTHARARTASRPPTSMVLFPVLALVTHENLITF